MRAVALAHFHIKHLTYNEWTYRVDAEHGGARITLQSLYWNAELQQQCINFAGSDKNPTDHMAITHSHGSARVF